MAMANFLTKETAGLPNWAWGAVVIVGVGAGILFMKMSNKSSTSSNASSLGTNAAGQVDTSQAAEAVMSQPSSEEVPNTTGDQVYIVQPPQPVQPTQPTPTPTPTPITYPTINIRGKGKDPSYDNKHSGIPFRSSPLGNKTGATQIGTIPFGTQGIQTTGSPVSGGNNFDPGNSSGSTLWYPVIWNGQSGYVSAYDVVGAGGGGVRMPRRSNILVA